MNIFERIQYGTCLENYCTDILVGILQKDQALLRSFCIEVLKIPNLTSTLEINPQVHYKGISIDDKKSFVDIVISGKDFLCFLEMKVESSENEGQLHKYNSVLTQQIQSSKFLRFCTKYNEEYRDYFNTEIHFDQLRWYHIYNFLKVSCQDNPLVEEFLEFLDINMMSDREITYDGTNALSFYENLEIFDFILTNLKPKEYKLELFNSLLKLKISPALHFRHKRYGYVFYPYNNEKSSGLWTSIFIGFEFKKDGIFCKIDIWSKDKESKIKNLKFNEKTDSYTKREEHDGISNYGIFSYKKVKESGMKIIDVEDWFMKELQNIQEVKSN